MIDLYKYQLEYLANLPKRAIMAADTGTGKTYMALAHYDRHVNLQASNNTMPLLILAPASKVRTGDWEREITEFFGAGCEPHYEVWSYEKFSRTATLAQVKAGKISIWKRFSPAHGGEQWAVIADEVHKAKNSESGVGKALYNVSKGASFFVGLSATPLPNGWIDFVNYMKIFGYVKNITSFKNRYCNYQRYKGFPELINYWHEDEMALIWQGMSKLLTKAQALDLPARTFEGVNFKRPAIYLKTILERKTADGRELDNPSALAHALRQTLTESKIGYLADLIDGTDENIVIFYNYITERDAILDMLKKKHNDRTVFRQDGEKHELPSKADWPNIHRTITLSHYKSGSTGVEMTYATQVVYFSPTYSYAEYMQSIGRVYRNGQTAKTTFWNFRTPMTIEEDIYKCLRGKNDFQATQWEVR